MLGGVAPGRRSGGNRGHSGWLRGGDLPGDERGEVKPQVVRWGIFLMGDAVVLVFLVVGIGVAGVLVVSAAVDLTDFLHEADHGLVMVMRHHGGEKHHHHGGERWQYGQSSGHHRELTQKSPDNLIVISRY